MGWLLGLARRPAGPISAEATVVNRRNDRYSSVLAATARSCPDCDLNFQTRIGGKVDGRIDGKARGHSEDRDRRLAIGAFAASQLLNPAEKSALPHE